jgi:hypothetical protein
MPMLMSEKPWYWATSAPQRATNPFDSARVSIVELSVLTPRLRIISLLLPVAWIASPRSVVRNQSMANLRMRAKASRIAIETQVPSHIFSRSGVNTVSSRSSGRFAFPMIRRLIDHRPIMVRMPASSPSMPPLVWSRPVM